MSRLSPALCSLSLGAMGEIKAPRGMRWGVAAAPVTRQAFFFNYY